MKPSAVARAAMKEPVLELADVRVAYGGIQAVKGITLAVYPGELVTLIGANGAGKTTTLKAIAGVLTWHGKIQLFGQSTQQLAPHQLLRQGLALVPEGRGVFTRMRVLENLQIGAYVRQDKAQVAADIDRMFTLFPRLRERAHQLAGTLSGGEQQMLALARALMSRPKLLLLDEPSMGLAPLMVEKIFEVISDLSKQGMPILLVEQNAQLALEIAHRGYVMDCGVLSHTDQAQALLQDTRVREAYLGDG